MYVLGEEMRQSAKSTNKPRKGQMEGKVQRIYYKFELHLTESFNNVSVLRLLQNTDLQHDIIPYNAYYLQTYSLPSFSFISVFVFLPINGMKSF